MFTRRMVVSVITGALLGIICIIGAQLRSGFANEAYYLFAFWFNRLLMGIVIGLAWGRLEHPAGYRAWSIPRLVSFLRFLQFYRL